MGQGGSVIRQGESVHPAGRIKVSDREKGQSGRRSFNISKTQISFITCVLVHLDLLIHDGVVIKRKPAMGVGCAQTYTHVGEARTSEVQHWVEGSIHILFTFLQRCCASETIR
jgi:hypothetical protein